MSPAGEVRLSVITVDNREKRPDPKTQRDAIVREGGMASVGHCPVGDLTWTAGPLMVTTERKSINDFITSAGDGRLARFVQESWGLKEGVDHLRVLLLEGDQFRVNTYGEGREWTPGALDNLLVSLQQLGVVVIRSKDMFDTATRIVALWKYTGREEHLTLLRTVRPGISGNYMSPKQRARIRFLMGLPGWGEKRAKAADKHFSGKLGLVLDMVRQREYKAFKNVEGIGKGLVDKAADFLGG